MSTIDVYLNIVPIWVLIIAPIIAIAVLLTTPAEHRLSISLIFAVSWLLVGRMPGLGSVAPVAKVTSIVTYAGIALAALLTPAPRRSVPPLVWLYVAVGITGFVYIIRVPDLAYALSIRLGWLTMAVAAVFTVRTLTSSERIDRFFFALALAATIGLLLPMSALLIDPQSNAFSTGHRRFTPWGANPNQVGTLLILATGVCLYQGVRNKLIWRYLFFAAGGAAIVMGVLTASRSIVFLLPIVALPAILMVTRRPGVLLAGGFFAAIIATLVLSSGEQYASFTRLNNLETGRYSIASAYVGVILQRPFFGLLLRPGESMALHSSVGQHPHNAYLYILYYGGLSYALPLFAMIGFTIYAMWVTLKKRFVCQIDPSHIIFAVCILIAAYLNAFTRESLFYPTYAWSWLQITLSIFLITTAWDLKRYGYA